jgi:hypothetical protein
MDFEWTDVALYDKLKRAGAFAAGGVTPPLAAWTLRSMHHDLDVLLRKCEAETEKNEGGERRSIQGNSDDGAHR